MANIADKQQKDFHNFDPLIQTEKVAFDAEQLISCRSCGRRNPPTRLECLYCTAELEIQIENASNIKLDLQRLELWEPGFNVIFTGVSAEIDPLTAKIAAMLSLDPEMVATMLSSRVAMPLARVRSEAAAAAVKHCLEQWGLECIVLGDAALAADKQPVRLKGLILADGGLDLHTFNTGAKISAQRSDVHVVVTGMIQERRVDVLEKKRRRGNTKVLDEVQTTSDEAVLDIYLYGDPTGYRVYLTGFDFSCLGAAKRLLAVDNFGQLTAALRAHLPSTRFADDYNYMRHMLAGVWELETRRDAKGLQRAGFGKWEFGSAASTSNLNQFTKYSRLQQHLNEDKRI